MEFIIPLTSGDQNIAVYPIPDLWHQVYKRVSLGNRPDPNVGAIGCEGGGSGLALSAYQDPERGQAGTPEKSFLYTNVDFPPWKVFPRSNSNI